MSKCMPGQYPGTKPLEYITGNFIDAIGLVPYVRLDKNDRPPFECTHADTLLFSTTTIFSYDCCNRIRMVSFLCSSPPPKNVDHNILGYISC
jgi:hypothetical protein